MSETSLQCYKIEYETLFTILLTHSKLKCYNYNYTHLRKDQVTCSGNTRDLYFIITEDIKENSHKLPEVLKNNNNIKYVKIQ